MKRIKEKFSLVLVFMTILIIIGLTIIIGPTKHFIEEYNINFIDYLYNMTGIIICGLFFIICGVNYWIKHLKNTLIKPSEETLYLLSVTNLHETFKIGEEYSYTFLDKNGKKYFYETNDKYDLNKFYIVNKTKDYILYIEKTSKDKFIISIKDSFWSNYYTPKNHYENTILLPIIYATTILFISVSIQAILPLKIICLLYSIHPLYIIFYDLITKHYKKQEYQELADKLNKNIR